MGPSKGEKLIYPYLRGINEKCRIVSTIQEFIHIHQGMSHEKMIGNIINYAKENNLSHGDILEIRDGTEMISTIYLVDISGESMNLQYIIDGPRGTPLSIQFSRALENPLKFYEGRWEKIPTLVLDHEAHYELIYGAAGFRHVSSECQILCHALSESLIICFNGRMAKLNGNMKLMDGKPVFE